MIIPIIVLAIVFVLIATRRIGNIKLQIWQIMLFGALAVLVTGQISPLDALNSINFDVILFLLGMFIVGEALVASGYLSHVAYKLFRRVKTTDQLLLAVLFSMGMASAFLMNDTLAIIGVPAVMLLARQCRVPPRLLLLTLAFAVTVGSVMSPIGNPQNLLIALNGNVASPFVTFFRYLFLPTILNLFLTFLILRVFYKKDLQECVVTHAEEPIKDQKLAFLSKLSLILVGILIAAKITTVMLNIKIDFRLTYIALIPALLLVAFSRRRIELVKKIDWRTLVFFIAMFILMESVWESGFIQSAMTGLNLSITSIPVVLLVSTLLSQVVSNVPLVALYLPMLTSAGASTTTLLALAAGSTIAGNLFILGAASNVIIIQNAEKKFGETIRFVDFAKIGTIVTAVNLLVYWLFLSIA